MKFFLAVFVLVATFAFVFGFTAVFFPSTHNIGFYAGRFCFTVGFIIAICMSAVSAYVVAK